VFGVEKGFASRQIRLPCRSNCNGPVDGLTAAGLADALWRRRILKLSE
jgi:hypothetical protein